MPRFFGSRLAFSNNNFEKFVAILCQRAEGEIPLFFEKKSICLSVCLLVQFSSCCGGDVTGRRLALLYDNVCRPGLEGVCRRPAAEVRMPKTVEAWPWMGRFQT